MDYAVTVHAGIRALVRGFIGGHNNYYTTELICSFENDKEMFAFYHYLHLLRKVDFSNSAVRKKKKILYSIKAAIEC